MPQTALAESGMPDPDMNTAPDMGTTDPLGATSVNGRIAAILTLTQQLTGLLVKEMAMLKTRRASALRETEPEKRRLSVLYAKEMRAIQMRPELLAGATPTQKARLREAAVAFKACLMEHIRVLARSRAVREAMIVAVGEELNRMRQPPSGYPRRANVTANSLSAGRPVSAAIALDRSV